MQATNNSKTRNRNINDEEEEGNLNSNSNINNNNNNDDDLYENNDSNDSNIDENENDDDAYKNLNMNKIQDNDLNQRNTKESQKSSTIGSLNEELILKENSNNNLKMKDIQREARLKLIKQKRAQEQLKRKEEIEEYFKRKQELREKQLKDRQKRIEEIRAADAERRAAVIERRRMREESTQARLAELIRRENERIETRVQLKPVIKINKDLITMNNQASVTTSLIVSDQNGLDCKNQMNKSHSAFNLTSMNNNNNNNHNNNHNNKKRDNNNNNNNSEAIVNTKRPLSSSRAQKSQHQGLAPSLSFNVISDTKSVANKNVSKNTDKHKKSHRSRSLCKPKSNVKIQQNKLESTLVTINERKTRSHTVPNTPKRNSNLTYNCINSPNNVTTGTSSTMKNSTCSSNTKNAHSYNNSIIINKCWEGPLAHFMLPTHAIYCRSDNSTERCPRACKVLAEASETVSTQSHNTTVRSAANIQKTLNRLAMPKTINKKIIENHSNTNGHTHNHKDSQLKDFINDHASHATSKTPSEASETSKKQPIKKSIKTSRIQVTSKPINTNIDSNDTNNKKPSSSLMTRSLIIERPKSSLNTKILSPKRDLSLTKSTNNKTHNVNTQTITKKPSTSKQHTSSVNNTAKVTSAPSSAPPPPPPPPTTTTTTTNIKEQTITNDSTEINIPIGNKNTESNGIQSTNETTKTAAPTEITENENDTALNEEELYKKKMEEKRREAREKAAKEAEIEKLKQEELRKQEEERLRIEEELERKAAEEEERLLKLAREQEEERIRIAIEQQERLENERKLREEQERKAKEEAERKAKEDFERVERERIEKSKKEEEARIERKKKVDEIMKRFHKDNDSNINNNQNETKSNCVTPNNSSNDLIENNGQQSDQKYKTPLLQSILSKTRLNSILNKYADDNSSSSSSLMTKSLIINDKNNTNGTSGEIETIELNGNNNGQKPFRLHESTKIAFDLENDNKNSNENIDNLNRSQSTSSTTSSNSSMAQAEISA